MGLYGPGPLGQVTTFCTKTPTSAADTAVTITAAIDTVAAVTGGNDRAICYLFKPPKRGNLLSVQAAPPQSVM